MFYTFNTIAGKLQWKSIYLLSILNMKKLFLYLGIVAATLVATDRVFYYCFTKYIFSKTFNGDSGGAINYTLKKQPRSDFFILGSSRAKYHIDPSLLTALYNGNGYNAGKNGYGGIVYNDMLLHLILNEPAAPKMILLQADPRYFFKTGNEDFTDELLPLYPFVGNSVALQNFINDNTGYAERFKLFFHAYRYNGKFAGVIYNYATRQSFTGNNGFESLAGKIDSSTFQAPEPLSTQQTYSAVKINLLTDVVKTCNARKIRLAVVFPPTYKNSNFLQQATDTIIRVLNKSGELSIYDFSDIEKLPALQPAYLWKDLSHMNKTGAAIFSKMLNDSLLEKNKAIPLR